LQRSRTDDLDAIAVCAVTSWKNQQVDVSPATWNALSKLLDEALDLEPAARAAWIDRVGATQPELAPILRKLLAAHATSETGDVLQQLPRPADAVNSIDATGLAVGSRVGPYRLIRELGGGGMADVWLAERADGAFEREVAQAAAPHAPAARSRRALRARARHSGAARTPQHRALL
jgi:hypothetical protein